MEITLSHSLREGKLSVGYCYRTSPSAECWVSPVRCNCTLTNTFHMVGRMRVWPFLNLFLLSHHMGSHMTSSEDLYPFLEGGCCYALGLSWMTTVPRSQNCLSISMYSTDLDDDGDDDNHNAYFELFL